MTVRYSLLEDHVDGYTTAIDGMNVTNKYTPAEEDDDEKMFTITYDLNDSNYIGLWLAFLMLSAGALASIVIYRRKRSE